MERNKLPLHTQDIYSAFLLESANCTSANQHIYNKWSVMISWEIYLIWSKFARKKNSLKVWKYLRVLSAWDILQSLLNKHFYVVSCLPAVQRTMSCTPPRSAASLQPPARASPRCRQEAAPRSQPATPARAAPAAKPLLPSAASHEAQHLLLFLNRAWELKTIDDFKPWPVLQISRGVLGFST